jgi:HAD superfamily hydrolase (TIGR01509 family)
MVEVLGRRYQAAIFDLDGTLADSMHVWDHVCRDWLSLRGIAAGPDLEQDIASMTLTQAADYVIRNYGVALAAADIMKEWENMVFSQYAHTVSLKDGAAELVQNLGAKGMKLAIATSCFPAACEALLARYGLGDLFSVMVYADEVNRDKSFPDIYLACARRLGIESAACVVFEDLYASLSGIRAAGMAAAAVYDESGASFWDRFKNEADFAFVSLRELLDGQAAFVAAKLRFLAEIV